MDYNESDLADLMDSYLDGRADAKAEIMNNPLLAAAPEMLEALATIRTLAGFEDLLRTKYSPALVYDLLKQVDHVINKAKGV